MDINLKSQYHSVLDLMAWYNVDYILSFHLSSE